MGKRLNPALADGSHDSSVASTADEFTREFPWVDRMTIESHLAFVQAHAVLASTLARKYAELGTSVSRFNALRILHYAPDRRLTIRGLGTRLGVSSASVTRLVDGLIRDGWVRRVAGDTDKRITHVELLDSGEARFVSLLPRVMTIWNEVWDCLDEDEKKALVGLNSKLRSRLVSQTADTDLDLVEY